MAMEIRKTVPMFFSVAFIGACVMSGSAAASERGLAFQGAMVNGGCDPQASSDRVLQAPHPTGVNAPIAHDLRHLLAACGEQKLAVEAHYVTRSTADTKEHTGVVMLTYQ
jgi:hypothetical protein